MVVALSGGVDSVVLLDLLHRLAPSKDWRLVAAHLDHGLRPESVEDVAFCRDVCAARGIEFAAERVDVAARAARTGEGVEAAGRHARYEFLERVRTEHGCDRIATAHHLDDHVESVLLALGRGTGLRGLRGIAPVRGHLIRPLRAVRRAWIEAHAREHGLSWREDRSNTDPERVRNRLRHGALESLESALPVGAFERIGATGQHVATDVDLLDELVAARLDALTLDADETGLALERAGFLAAGPELRSALLRAAASRLFARTSHQRWNAGNLEDVLDFVERAHAGQRWSLPGGGRLAVERDRLILTGRSDELDDAGPGTHAVSPVRLATEFLPASRHGCSLSGPDVAFLDAARVRPPFVLRPILPGDRLQPHGMEGHKRLVTLLSERAVPRERRHAQLVVCDRQRIVWAVGVTTAHSTRIDEDSRWIWQLRIEPALRPDS